jgi:NAD(P)-dependent dehydrogenase (short-subunit alcohol dehydrogenase family)
LHSISQTAVLVTGATDGLGLAVARRLAQSGAALHLHGRDADRLELHAWEIMRATGNRSVATHLADFASLAEVRSLASGVASATRRLHVLINNAGIGPGKPEGAMRQTSRDGYELRFAVNYLAGALLSLRLLPLLLDSHPARIVNVSSLAQTPIDFQDVMLEADYDGLRAYGQSKLAQIIFGFELANLVRAEGVTVISLHPGSFMPTKMAREAGRAPVDTLEVGIESTTWAASSPELRAFTGCFFDRTKQARAHDQAYDADARRRLWELTLALIGETAPAYSRGSTTSAADAGQ